MAKFNVTACPVCDNNSFTPVFTCTDYFVTGEEFGIKTCNACGFRITENIEDETGIGRYYQSEQYVSHSNTSKGLVNTAYHRVRQFMLKQKGKLVEKAAGTDQGHILDVGTGTAYFLNEMKQHGWQVTGTEKSSDARAFAKKEFGLEIQDPDDLFQLSEASFDVITLWHVLEHIHRLKENMQVFNRLLKDHGRLIIAVPNFESYDARHYRNYWAAYDVPRHIWHFSPRQMKQLGEKYGFRLEKMKTMPFDSFYVSMLSEKYKKSNAALVKGVFHGKISWLNSLLNPGRCSSVIYIFEKS